MMTNYEDREEFKAALYKAVMARKNAQFMPSGWVEGEIYDCVTFIASVYNALGLTAVKPESMPSYKVFSRGATMLELTMEVIEGTCAFSEIGQAVEEIEMGDLLLFSNGDRGHHVAIALDDIAGRKVAHSVKGRGVVIDDLLPPLSENVWMIYRPKGGAL